MVKFGHQFFFALNVIHIAFFSYCHSQNLQKPVLLPANNTTPPAILSPGEEYWRKKYLALNRRIRCFKAAHVATTHYEDHYIHQIPDYFPSSDWSCYAAHHKTFVKSPRDFVFNIMRRYGVYYDPKTRVLSEMKERMPPKDIPDTSSNSTMKPDSLTRFEKQVFILDTVKSCARWSLDLDLQFLRNMVIGYEKKGCNIIRLAYVITTMMKDANDNMHAIEQDTCEGVDTATISHHKLGNIKLLDEFKKCLERYFNNFGFVLSTTPSNAEKTTPSVFGKLHPSFDSMEFKPRTQ